jgi:hypothetical protein
MCLASWTFLFLMAQKYNSLETSASMQPSFVGLRTCAGILNYNQ